MTVRHQFNKDDLSVGGEQHRASLMIQINNDVKGIFKHNPNTNKDAIKIEETDGLTRHPEGDWSVNPYYNGNFFVEIDCSDECNCSVIRKEATCRVKVEAIYQDPGLVVESYG